MTDRCPTCTSPDPMRHPAMQFDGEVQVCPDPFHPITEHTITDEQITELYNDATAVLALCNAALREDSPSHHEDRQRARAKCAVLLHLKRPADITQESIADTISPGPRVDRPHATRQRIDLTWTSPACQHYSGGLSEAGKNRLSELAAIERATDSQRERYHAGVLPEDELLTIVRAELFKGFTDLAPRWNKAKDIDLMIRRLTHGMHTCNSCNNHGFHGESGKDWCTTCGTEDTSKVEHETTDVAELDAQEWDVLRKLQGAADAVKAHPWIRDHGGAVAVESFTRWVTCTGCAEEACRSTTKITITWAGRALTREYVLTK